jgi:hypothetical protein
MFDTLLPIMVFASAILWSFLAHDSPNIASAISVAASTTTFHSRMSFLTLEYSLGSFE